VRAFPPHAPYTHFAHTIGSGPDVLELLDYALLLAAFALAVWLIVAAIPAAPSRRDHDTITLSPESCVLILAGRETLADSPDTLDYGDVFGVRGRPDLGVRRVESRPRRVGDRWQIDAPPAGMDDVLDASALDEDD
jgi:hypothetical protein